MYSQGFQPAIFGDANKVAAQNHQTLFKSSSTTRVVVSSCGGPIGVQNLNGEMYGWNLMPPSGTLVNIDISGPKELQRVIAKKYKPAKPRFCVALDYIQTHAEFQVISWIPGFTKGNFWIVARNIPFATNFIESVDIYVGDANRHGFSKYSMQVKPQGFNHVYDASFADVDDFCDDALDADEKGKILFAEVRFNKALAGVSYYKQYNFDDAWIFRIVVEKNALGRLLIRPAEKDQACKSDEALLIYPSDFIQDMRPSAYQLPGIFPVPSFTDCLLVLKLPWDQLTFAKGSSENLSVLILMAAPKAPVPPEVVPTPR